MIAHYNRLADAARIEGGNGERRLPDPILVPAG